MTNKEMANIAVEAAKIKLDYPGITYGAAIEQAKEVLRSEVDGRTIPGIHWKEKTS